MRPTRYQLHVERWSDCTACDLHEERKNVVLARGSLPADVLLVGESPGKGEDSLGSPFVGPAGQLLDEIVDRSLGTLALCPLCRAVLQGGAAGIFCANGHEHPSANCGLPIRTAFTNLIACIPLDPEDATKLEEPPQWAIEACTPRLQEMIALTNPRLLVRVGRFADDYLTPGYRYSIPLHRDIPAVSIQHPSYFLRLPTIQQSLAVQRAIIILKNAVLELDALKKQSV